MHIGLQEVGYIVAALIVVGALIWLRAKIVKSPPSGAAPK